MHEARVRDDGLRTVYEFKQTRPDAPPEFQRPEGSGWELISADILTLLWRRRTIRHFPPDQVVGMDRRAKIALMQALEDADGTLPAKLE